MDLSSTLSRTPPKNSFQQELEAKMKERKKKGLSVEISDSDSEDELGSDNELLSHFNMTSKTKMAPVTPPSNRRSPYSNEKSYLKTGSSSPYSKFGKKSLLDSEDDDDEDDDGGGLLMTMKKPWQRAALQDTVDANNLSNTKKSRALSALDEIALGPKEEDKGWQPPNFRKKSVTSSPEIAKERSRIQSREEEDEVDSRRIRPKSPSIRGRSGSLLESLDKNDKPAPSPRFTRKKEIEVDEESPRPKPRPRARGIFDDDFGKKEIISAEPKSPKTPKSPKSPHTPKSKPSSAKSSPVPAKRSETTKSKKAETPTDDKPSKSILDMMADDSTAITKKKKRRGLLASSSESEDEKPANGLLSKGRKSPFSFDKTSSLEEERAKRRANMDSTDSFDPFQKPTLRKGQSLDSDDDSAFHPVPQRRSRTAQPTSHERESSICRDVTKDPGPMKHAPGEATDKQKMKSKSYTREKQLLDDAIDHVDGAQNQTAQGKTPDAALSKTTPARPNSAPFPNRNLCDCCRSKTSVQILLSAEEKRKTPKNKPQPRYTKPQIPDPNSARTVDFNSTTDIREAVYLDWYAQKMERSKKELKEKKQVEKEAEEKKKKDKEEKIMEAKVSYQAWMEKKKDVITKKVKDQKLEEEKKRRKAIEEKIEKKKEAEMSFKSWKENKDVLIREKERQKKREEEKKTSKKEEDKYMREKDSHSAFKGWKAKKDEIIQDKVYEVKKIEKQKEMEKLREQRKREREAERAYDKWMNKKEHDVLSARSKRQPDELMMTRPAWSPASRTIPVGR